MKVEAWSCFYQKNDESFDIDIKEELIMPKMKTSKAAAKRFKKTGTGKLKRMKAYKSHILTKKSTKRKRGLRKSAYASTANEATIKRLILYK